MPSQVDRLHLRERKAEHSTTYPLAPVVGEAIVDYLKNGRPDMQSRLLFWRHLAPRLPLTQAAVSAMTPSRWISMTALAQLAQLGAGFDYFSGFCVA